MHLFVSIAFTAVFVLSQTTLLHHAAIHGVIPDVSLIVLVFLANRNGKIHGETVGFAAGLMEDFLSLSPLGFHALMKTLIGYLFGITHGVIFIGAMLMPMLMVGLATFIKSVIAAVLVSLFSVPLGTHAFFSWNTLIEIGYNVALSPFIFAFLGLFAFLVPKSR